MTVFPGSAMQSMEKFCGIEPLRNGHSSSRVPCGIGHWIKTNPKDHQIVLLHPGFTILLSQKITPPSAPVPYFNTFRVGAWERAI